ISSTRASGRMAASRRACSTGKNLSSAAQASSAGLVKAASSAAIWFMKSSSPSAAVRRRRSFRTPLSAKYAATHRSIRSCGRPPWVSQPYAVGRERGGLALSMASSGVSVPARAAAMSGRNGLGGEVSNQSPVGGGGGDGGAERLGREVVERVAGGQAQPAEPSGVARRDHLGDGGPAVVADQGDVAEVQRVQEVGDQAAEPGWCQVGAGPHRGG